MRTNVIAACFAALMAMTILTGLNGSRPPVVPPCAEDEFIQGTGQFHSNGYWDGYECAPSDDWVPMFTQ